MDLDLEDLELIHALQIAPRASWTQLASALRRHPATLSARWDRLRADGRAWVIGHRGASPLQGCMAFIGVECQPGKRAEVLDRLCAIPEILTLEEAARAWNFRLTVLTRNWQEVVHNILPVVRNDPSILRTHVSVATKVKVMGDNWRLDCLSPEQQRRVAAWHPEVSRPPGLTPPHFEEMMQVLARDGRATAAEVAAATGTHPTTAARQLRLGIETGLIVFRCELAQEYSGYPVACQWYVRVPGAELPAAEQYLRSHRTLRLCASTTGDANLTFVLWLRTPGEIPDIEAGLQAVASGVHVLESEVGVRTHKRMGWLLNDDSTASGEVVVR